MSATSEPHQDSLRLLGAFQLFLEGQEVNLGQARLEELVALLAIHGDGPVPRSEIAGLFWPESSEGQARNNARTLLHRLRQAWPSVDEAISIDGVRLEWPPENGIQVDTHRLQELVDLAQDAQSSAARIRLLEEAASSYTGDFLPDCYADWALAERERLRNLYSSLLEQLVDALYEERVYDDAATWAQTLQRFDPLRESSYRRLMLVHAAAGERAAALRVYHSCATMLREELGVGPSFSTEQLHARITETEEAVPTEDSSPQTVQRQRMVGRRSEWQALVDTWQTARQGSARCVLLWGEAGIGKTRLAEEFATWVQHQGITCASSRCYAIRGALVYAPIAEWLRAPSIRQAIEDIEDLWRVELARLLPELLVERPELPQPGPMSETWQQQRFYQSIIHSLQAAPAPLVLHLDDMQWSDPETLTLLQFLLHSGRNHPLLLVGGIRMEDAGDNQALAEFLQATGHTGQLVDVHLGPLSESEAIALINQTSEQDMEPHVARSLYLTGEGHPLFITEAVRSGFTQVEPASQASERLAGERLGVTPMPPRIYSLLATRLHQLSPVAQQVASVAAVIGRAFDHTLLAASLSLDELALIDALDELWRRRIIREQPGDSYDFSHDRIREVAYQEISRARSRHYHRQVASALESVHDGDIDPICGELATHYALAGDPQSAYAYYVRAARISLENYALPRAETMLEAALQYVPDDDERMKLLLEQDGVFQRSLQFELWRRNLDEEEALLSRTPTPDVGLSLRHQLSCSGYFVNVNQGEKAVEAARRALRLSEEVGDEYTSVRCYQALGEVYWRLARMAESRDAYAQMLAHARAAGDEVAEGKSLGNLSAAGMFSGMPTEQLLDLITRSLVIAQQVNDKPEMANLHNKLAYVRMRAGMGHRAQVEADFRRALELALQSGSLMQESVTRSTLGHFFALSGDYRSAAEWMQESAEVERDFPVLWRNWVTLWYMGSLRMQMGRLDAAIGMLTEAVDGLGSAGIRHYETMARCDLGLALHLGGRECDARTELSRVLAAAEGNGDLRYEALANTRLGYVMEASGEQACAESYYQRGRDLHHGLGEETYAMNALAGLARIAAATGNAHAALESAITVWDTVGGQDVDATVETARTLRTCFAIFDAHEDERADAVLAMAWDQLQRRAATIDDAADLQSFWALEDHSFFRAIAPADAD